MKLILKQVAREIELTSLGDVDRKYAPGIVDEQSPFGLHTEDGQLLPCQVSTTMKSEAGGLVHLTVVFVVDGKSLRVEGHEL